MVVEKLMAPPTVGSVSFIKSFYNDDTCLLEASNNLVNLPLDCRIDIWGNPMAEKACDR